MGIDFALEDTAGSSDQGVHVVDGIRHVDLVRIMLVYQRLVNFNVKINWKKRRVVRTV
jgi:hypothetical protein